MNFNRKITMPVIAAILISGCSTRARDFSPTLTAPAADEVAFGQMKATCSILARQGVKSGFKDAALLTGAGAAGALGGAAAATATGAVGFGMSGAAAGAATAGLLAIPLGIGFGVSRLIRSGKERRLKRAMSDCLVENGYSVASWSVERKSKVKEEASLAVRTTNDQP